MPEPTSVALISAALTGMLGMCGVCLAKTKCLCKTENGRRTCVCGFMDKSVVDDSQDVELRTTALGDTEILYIAKEKHHHVVDDDDESDDGVIIEGEEAAIKPGCCVT